MYAERRRSREPVGGHGPEPSLPAGPYDPEHHLDPYDLLGQARSRCPVARLPGGRTYVAGHRETAQALADDRNLSGRSNLLLGPLPDGVPPFVTQTDPPGHTNLRRAPRTLFLRSNVVAQRPMMRHPQGQRPFRLHIDPADDGAEKVNDLGDKVREDFYRRMTSLTSCTPVGGPTAPAESPRSRRCVSPGRSPWPGRRVDRRGLTAWSWRRPGGVRARRTARKAGHPSASRRQPAAATGSAGRRREPGPACETASS